MIHGLFPQAERAVSFLYVDLMLLGVPQFGLGRYS